MKTACRRFTVILLFCLPLHILPGAVNTAAAEDDTEAAGKKTAIPIPDTDITYQWFLSYADGEEDGEDFSQFYVNRGYINITSRFNDWISTRITPDITVDREGDGMGDLEMRFKYCYVMFHLPSASIFTKPKFEFGLAHRPWLDFEEHINNYRSQGTMFLERNHIFNSADNGITFMTLLGGEMSEQYQKTVSSKYPGRYGSIAMGIYNGGGYHALENNMDKVFETRLTLRPLPDMVPGLQVSYLGMFGKGNTEAEPDWTVNNVMLSLEHQYYVFTGQYYTGEGNSGGSALYPDGESREQEGWSVFGEHTIPGTSFGFIGRYDKFERNTRHPGHHTERWIGGLVYHIAGHNKALLDYDTVEDNLTGERDSMLKFTIEVHF